MFSKSAVDAGAICCGVTPRDDDRFQGASLFQIMCRNLEIDLTAENVIQFYYRHVLARSVGWNIAQTFCETSIENSNTTIVSSNGIGHQAQLGTNLRLCHSLCGLICQVFGQLTQSGTLVGTCRKMVVKHGRDLCCGVFKSLGEQTKQKRQTIIEKISHTQNEFKDLQIIVFSPL